MFTFYSVFNFNLKIGFSDKLALRRMRTMEGERQRLLQMKQQNSWLTRQLGIKQLGATQASVDLIDHFESRLTELEEVSAAESWQLEALVEKLIASMDSLENSLVSSM